MFARINILLTSLLFISFAANADIEIDPKYYLGAGVANQTIDFDDYDSGMAAEFTVGAELTEMFGVEGEITLPLTEPQESYGGIDLDLEVVTFAVYGTAFRAINDQFRIFAKAGVLHRRLDVSTNVGSGSLVQWTDPSDGRVYTVGADDDADTGFSVGAGMLFEIVRDFDVKVAYTAVEKNMDHFSVGGAYRF